MAEAESSQKQHEISLNIADPLCGRVLNGRFSIVEPIGSGGMGKVYKAIQSPLDRVVALKVLHPHFANSKDPGFVKRFVLEASLTSRLRHPNTVTVIDYGQTEDGIFYIAMEYLEGHTVAEMLAKHGPISWQRGIGIGQQVCRSLREAHKFGILHRDLKPANVMLLDEADNDVVKVLDFGLVKSFVPESEAVNPAITQNGMLLGSPQYMAPEQAKNQSDPRSDIYSFGILLYEMLTTRPPFQAKDYLEVIVKHIKDPPPTFRQMRPDLDLPVEVERVVMRCLEKEPHHRYQTMDELLDALRLVGGGQVGLSSSFQAQQAASQTGKWALPPGVTPPPLPGGRGLATPNPNNPAMLPATPAPSGGNVPTGAHMRTPTGQFYHLTQPQSGGQTPAPSAPTPLFGSVHKTMPPGPALPPAEPNLFSVASTEETGNPAVKNAVIAAVALLVLGLGGWLLSRDTRGEAEQAQAAKPAVVPGAASPTDKPADAAPARAVRFKVSTEPSGAQVFMGARDLGRTPTSFEVPPGPDGTATAELVFILDGHHPLAVTAGGSGDVLITQRLQRKASERPAPSGGGARVARSAPPPRDEVPETVAPPPEAPRAEVAATPALGGPGSGGFQGDPYASPYAASATASAVANRPATIEAAPSEGITVPAAAIVAAPATTRASDGSEIIAFGEGMERPVPIESGKPVQYSREALTAQVQGLMIVKCVITTAGRLENCRVIKSLPYMEKPVLESLYSRLYKPVTFQGRPVSVSYVFDVKLVLPRR